VPFDLTAPVVANTPLGRDYNVVALAAPEIARQALPGQFVMVKTAPGVDPLLRRPFSVFEILRDEAGRPMGISLLNKAIGAGTRLLFHLRPGDRIGCLGPLGRPFEPVDPPAEAWMIAGGVGLAPFAALADSLREHGTRARLFYGGRTSADLIRLELFERGGIETSLATEDGSRGTRGFVTLALERALDSTPHERDVALYACGPTPMMQAVAQLAGRHRRACHVSVEPVMGCGLGGCYSCVVPMRRNGRSHYVRSCLEGPVFDAASIVWEELGTH